MRIVLTNLLVYYFSLVYFLNFQKSIGKRMIIIYGIKNCGSCKKALRWFGNAAAFRDIRTDPLSAELWEKFLNFFGEQLINTKSKTWKNLSLIEKNSNPVELLERFPTIMKRPVIECLETSRKTVGWTDKVQNHYS